jgi:signal transduction histidine kinase
LLAFYTNAQSVITFPKEQINLNSNVQFFIDSNSTHSFIDMLSNGNFENIKEDFVNLNYQEKNCWLKFSFVAKGKIENYILSISNPLLDNITFYYKKNSEPWITLNIDVKKTVSSRMVTHQYPAFVIPNLNKNDTIEVYLCVKAELQLLVPMKISSRKDFDSDSTNYNILIAIYIGIMLFMFLYNLFVYISTRDKNYLYYVIYVLFIAIAQSGLSGFSICYNLFDDTELNTLIIVFSSVVSGISALLFARGFLNLKHYAFYLYKGLHLFVFGYALIFVCYILGFHQLSFKLLDSIGLLVSIYALIFAVYVSLKNYRPAKFFLIAWSVFIIALIVFVLKNFSIISSNVFTNSSLQIGSAAESLLLSFALADKINIFRKEKELAQKEALSSAQENERIVREQNIILETKVTERTIELKESNTVLSVTLEELKSAQTLLVESEKMASLGQLTAGIAHEINNPINFVTSNINPLKRDVDMLLDLFAKIELLSIAELDSTEKQEKINQLKSEIDFDYLKTEIDFLLKGIKEGSTRTAEIVKGLRIFSRLDEDDLKYADINEGLDSTITIINNLITDKIKVEKKYRNIPLVECYPGKLNQVFLNVISNAIHAVKSKFGEINGGMITIETLATDTHLNIKFIDNGIGMSPETKHKLFEPFFTTKPVGVGTGLGLSIVYNTIKKHNGSIQVNSEIGEGTEFNIEIPLVQHLS